MSGAFKRVTSPGAGEYGRVYVSVEWDGRNLSITGVEGPKANGDCRGSCGQINMHPWGLTSYSEGWDAERAEKLRELWDRWHLNDMRAGCEHQRASWDTSERLEVVSYKLTSEAYRHREKLLKIAATAQATGETLNLSATDRALILLADWFKPCFTPPDADDPLSGCYEVEKREHKAAGWVRPSEHPRGLLCKPCEVCGYKYGSAWLFEHVPADVVEWLEALPDSGTTD